MKIGFLADTHLGYATNCRSNEAGINVRVQDGYDGFSESITQMIAAEVDIVIHGGDLFHVSHPQIADIVRARQEFLRLHAAGIPIIGISGNHDFSTNRSKLAATSAIHSPEQNINLWEEPYLTIPIADGITLHAVSHLGVIHAAQAAPIEGHINLLLSHGVAAVPGHELFTCVDSPGEAVLTFEMLTQHWDAVLLGHYHQRGEIQGLSLPNRPAIYAGSLLRRGFSDKPGGRGWVELIIDSDGVHTAYHDVPQRAQHDLPPIHAPGLSSSELTELIISNIHSVNITDAIVRQRVINASSAQRQGIDAQELSTLTASALQWRTVFSAAPTTISPTTGWNWDSTIHGIDTAYSQWLPEFIDRYGLTENMAERVGEHGVQYLLHAAGESNV